MPPDDPGGLPPRGEPRSGLSTSSDVSGSSSSEDSGSSSSSEWSGSGELLPDGAGGLPPGGGPGGSPLGGGLGELLSGGEVGVVSDGVGSDGLPIGTGIGMGGTTSLLLLLLLRTPDEEPELGMDTVLVTIGSVVRDPSIWVVDSKVDESDGKVLDRDAMRRKWR